MILLSTNLTYFDRATNTTENGKKTSSKELELCTCRMVQNTAETLNLANIREKVNWPVKNNELWIWNLFQERWLGKTEAAIRGHSSRTSRAAMESSRTVKTSRSGLENLDHEGRCSFVICFKFLLLTRRFFYFNKVYFHIFHRCCLQKSKKKNRKGIKILSVYYSSYEVSNENFIRSDEFR